MYINHFDTVSFPVLSLCIWTMQSCCFFRFYGKSEDGDEFNDAIRKLFLSFNILMDRPLEEAVKIKVGAEPVLKTSVCLCWWAEGIEQPIFKIPQNSSSSNVSEVNFAKSATFAKSLPLKCSCFL